MSTHTCSCLHIPADVYMYLPLFVYTCQLCLFTHSCLCQSLRGFSDPGDDASVPICPGNALCVIDKPDVVLLTW